VKTPVLRIIILSLAVRTQGKELHRRFVAIIWDVLHDSEARTAVCAVNKGVVVTPVSWVKQLTQAVIASSYIRRNERVARVSRLAGENGESLLTTQRNRGRFHAVNLGQRRLAAT
jgi:hypothetical protein